MPSFIAAIEPLPAAQTVKPKACSSFDAFLSVKKSMRSLLCQRRKNVLFSLRRKAPKDSPRRCLGLSTFYWEYTRLPTVVCSRFARQANIRRARSNCHWKARARRRKAAGMRSRFAQTIERNVRGFFSFFSCPTGKRTFFLFFRNQLFLPAHIRTKRGGHVHRAVGIQIVFKESDEHSRRGDDRVVERMREIFFAVRAVYADF